MFKEGNLVRLITTEGDGDIMKVHEDSDSNSGTTRVEDGSFDGVRGYDTHALELVTDSPQEYNTEARPMELQTPRIDEDYLIEQINKYMTSLVVSMRDQDITDKITLTIKCENYTSDDSTIEYKAMIGYDMKVESEIMSQSCNILVARYQQNKELEIKAIPHYK